MALQEVLGYTELLLHTYRRGGKKGDISKAESRDGGIGYFASDGRFEGGEELVSHHVKEKGREWVTLFHAPLNVDGICYNWATTNSGSTVEVAVTNVVDSCVI